MTINSAQDFLFQRIKELLPADISMVESISDILHISTDSAYRRIRGETPLVLDEARVLCDHFRLSLDHLLNSTRHSVLFHDTRVNSQDQSYQHYLTGLIQLAQYTNGFFYKEVIYLTKDIPLFHNFYYRPLVAFRYFFWMKTIVQHPDFINREFELDCLPPDVEALSIELVKLYATIPSVEIWNTECVNSTIAQIEFYRDSGVFSSNAVFRSVYEALEETILHIRAQAEQGTKFFPGTHPAQKANFRFFYNRVVLGDNTILITTDHAKTVYLNYDILNYLSTKDDTFCQRCEEDLRNLMRKGTLISETGEKQRNIFFNILLQKILDRKKAI